MNVHILEQNGQDRKQTRSWRQFNCQFDEFTWLLDKAK